jgi:hypothetical protein
MKPKYSSRTLLLRTFRDISSSRASGSDVLIRAVTRSGTCSETCTGVGAAYTLPPPPLSIIFLRLTPPEAEEILRREAARQRCHKLTVGAVEI